MKLIQHLVRSAGRDIAIVAAAALVAGISTAAMVVIINGALHHTYSRSVLASTFIAVTILKFMGGLVSNLRLVRLSQRCVLDLCDDLCRRVAAAPFRQVETIGTSRILSTLTDDVTGLAGSIQALPGLAVNLAVLAACSIYLAWTSFAAAVLMTVLAAAGMLAYRLILARAYVAIRAAREGRNALFSHFRSLTEGLKELKLSRGRREAFLEQDIGGSIRIVYDQSVRAMNEYAVADAWTQFTFYAMLGILLFAMPDLSSEALTAYVFTALYVAAPVWAIIAGLPTFTRGEEALRRLTELREALATPEQESSLIDVGRTPPAIALEAVTFVYPETANSSGFALGPLDIELKPGELVFVIGGNGSGKSTFVKLLTGLYRPNSGRLLVDGVPVSTDAEQRYREHFSVVYSDFFLFDRLHGFSVADVEQRAPGYLAALQLQHKVRVDGNRLSTTALSQGQRRRLALLTAYLEDRPVYVLDEWAADQDPAYRSVFYSQILPELKRRGKTVVVITHDDRYFHLGDRLIKLDYGKVVATTASADFGAAAGAAALPQAVS